MAPAQNIKTFNQYKRKNALSLKALNVLRLLTVCLVVAGHSFPVVAFLSRFLFIALSPSRQRLR